nr:hypothetical protein [uncultured Leptotrichia sp.]
MSVINLKKITIGLYLITFFNISFGVAVNNQTQKKSETTKPKTVTPKKGTGTLKKETGDKSKETKEVTKQTTTKKTAGSTQKNDTKITKPAPKSSATTKAKFVKTPAKTIDKKVDTKSTPKTSNPVNNKKLPKTMGKKTSDEKNPENKKSNNKSSGKKSNNSEINKPSSTKGLSDVEIGKDINKTKKSIEKEFSGKKENMKILEKSQKMVDDKIEKDKQVDRVKIDKITKANPEKILSFTKNSEEILASATMVSTENYKILFTGINEVNSDESSELTKSDKLNTSFVAGFQIKKPEIELESVKVYLIISEKSEKLLISSKVPENRVKREENKPFVEEWGTEVGKNSKIKGFGNEKDQNPVSWNGESDIIGTVSLRNLLKDNKIDLEKVKISKLKDLFALSNKKYRYLFKFVIKAKGKEEEVIFQPGILNIKLIGGKNIK